jgi:uncharacterized protein
MIKDAKLPPVETVEQHGVGRSAVLHLLPGALATLVFAALAPLAAQAGFPPLAALMLAALLAAVPFQLGWMLMEGQRQNGRVSLRGVVVYRQPVPGWQVAGLAVVFVVWGLFWFNILAPLERLIQESVFGWLPAWWFFDRLPEQAGEYARPALAATFVLALLVNGLLAPVVEEMYFRGYLLPRLARLGSLAPLLNVLLFSVYHFFSPWQSLSRIVALLPMAYAVWWRRNFYIGLATHVALNLLGTLLLGLLLLGS